MMGYGIKYRGLNQINKRIYYRVGRVDITAGTYAKLLNGILVFHLIIIR